MLRSELLQLVENSIEDKVKKTLQPYQDELFEKINKPLANKLLTGMKGYESEEKFHNFDTYEERDSKGFDSFRDFLKSREKLSGFRKLPGRDKGFIGW
ncbi:hypothetical protein ES703_30724 [subsurface metagenome]